MNSRVEPEHAVPKSLTTALIRIGLDEIDFSTRSARDIVRDPEEAVHRCRKSIKRLRALVRLGKGCDRRAWREVDHRLRDTGRLLSQARDASMLERRAREVAGGAVRVSVDGGVAADLVPEVTAMLARTRPSLEKFLAKCDWTLDLILAGLSENASSAARDRGRFEERNRQTDAHAWRKGVQRYLNQLRLVAELFPPALDGRIADLDALSEVLGTYHDLSVLKRSLKTGKVTADEPSRLLRHLKDRQAALRKRALTIRA